MLTLDQAATQYGVTVTRIEDAAFTVAGFILSHEHMPAILLFKIQEPGGAGVPSRHVVVQNGGHEVSFPTNQSGYSDMGVGGGSKYHPERGESGPHSAWVQGPNVAVSWDTDSDVVHGLGWFGGTDHQSLITVWERVGEGGNMGEIEYDLPPGFNMHTHFRQARVEPRPGPGYHVKKLTAVGVPRKRDDKVLTVTFRNADGSPAAGVRVRVSTYGKAGPGFLTDKDGQIFFDMGGGEDESWWYAVPGEPPKAILPVAAGKMIGDTVVVGVVQGRWDWLNIEYQWSGDEGPPEAPTFDNLEVGATDFSVRVQCEGASSIGYTLDGPAGYHRPGEMPLGEAGALLKSDTLSPATVYHLKAWGSNENGDGFDSFLEFVTLAEDEPPDDPPLVPPDWDVAIDGMIARLEDVIETLKTLKALGA